MKNNKHTNNSIFAFFAILRGKHSPENPTEHKPSVFSVPSVVKTLPFIVLCSSLIALPTFAQTEIETRMQLDTINQQIAELRQQNARSQQAKETRKEMKDAAKDYEKAIKKIPGIKEIDKEIETFHKQLSQLQKRKIKLIKTNDSSLKPIKKRIDDISIALREIITGGEQGRALQAEQQRLIKEIDKLNKTTN